MNDEDDYQDVIDALHDRIDQLKNVEHLDGDHVASMYATLVKKGIEEQMPPGEAMELARFAMVDAMNEGTETSVEDAIGMICAAKDFEPLFEAIQEHGDDIELSAFEEE